MALRQAVATIEVRTTGRGLFEVTREIAGWLDESAIGTGLLTVWCRHTSASLVVQENASPEVLDDIGDFVAGLAPEEARRYRHGVEGPDDMPAHLRAMLTDVQLSVPVLEGRMALGTWQGIFLFEHRARPHRRSLALHVLGD